VLNPQRADWSNRTSFVIAPDGKILLSHTDMKPESHIEKTLATVKAHKEMPRRFISIHRHRHP
jgi:peroxiredoxin